MKDFTPVCTTELITFERESRKFQELNANLVSLSIDSSASQLAWIYDIYITTGIRISFPIIADRAGEIARKYGMISNEISNTKALGNVYMIDEQGVIRAILVYPLNIGRNTHEILRILKALQITDKNNLSTPVNWNDQDPIISNMPQNINQVLQKKENLRNNKNGLNWYLSFDK